MTGSEGDGRKPFLAFCRLRLDFDLRHLMPLDRVAPINYSPSCESFPVRYASPSASGCPQVIRQLALAFYYPD